MEASQGGLQPLFFGPLNGSSFVGVCTAALEHASVAGMGGSAVVNHAPRRISLIPSQSLPGGAFPVVGLVVVPEAEGCVCMRPPVGMSRHGFERDGHTQEKQGVAEREPDPGAEPREHHFTSSITSARGADSSS